MRGTFVTMLLRAGCDLNEIAVCMGWSIRHAANIIERYAKIVPEVTDQIGIKLAAFKRAATAFALERQRIEAIGRPMEARRATSASKSTGRAVRDVVA